MLQQAAGDDAERDLYFDESSNTWDMSGLRSDLEVYGVTALLARRLRRNSRRRRPPRRRRCSRPRRRPSTRRSRASSRC